MKIKYLGTAAAEAIPALFCECDLCTLARKEGGKNIRTRSQALIDEKILIDFGPDTNLHSLFYGLELSKIKSCLLTHTHPDHFYPNEIKNRVPGFSHLKEGAPPLTFYASKQATDIIDDLDIQNDIICTKSIVPFEPFQAEGYTVTPLPANHAPNTSPIFYMLQNDGKAMLYAHDTGLLENTVWDYFESTKPYFSFVSLDCTGGNKQISYNHHMNVERCVFTKENLISSGFADENTLFCLNHFSHNGLDCLYEDFSRLAKKLGFLVSFDGMEVEF